jgi:hypothetical protein
MKCCWFPSNKGVMILWESQPEASVGLRFPKTDSNVHLCYLFIFKDKIAKSWKSKGYWLAV